ncbi:sensor histidine kinase [Planctomicrobium sp. SH661]|uniref:sensor histidine kinase n=1 Tax=Planctomicrobium sp. SH661 TaxID=3448124 RepID=UPI003F5B5B8E
MDLIPTGDLVRAHPLQRTSSSVCMFEQCAENAGIQPDSGVDHLLSGAEPWRGADAVAVHLAAACASKYSLNLCALCWQDPVLHQTALVLHPAESPSAGRQIRLNGLRSVEELSGLLPEESERITQLTWVPMCVGEAGVPPLRPMLGLPTGCSLEQLDSDWMNASLTLLQWGARFDAELQTRKLASLAEYAAGAGHEINNPLGSIIGRASQLLKNETDAENRRALETIGAQAYRIGDMIGDTMLFANPPAMKRQTLNLTEVIREIAAKFRNEIEEHSIQFEESVPESLHLSADAHHLRIVVSELFRNSIRALQCVPDGSNHRLRVSGVAQSRHSQPGVFLEITDNGTGLTAEQLRHCFDPFYSGRQAGRGLGFGLSKCWRIVRMHGGEIDLSSEAGETHVRIWWPAETT